MKYLKRIFENFEDNKTEIIEDYFMDLVDDGICIVKKGDIHVDIDLFFQPTYSDDGQTSSIGMISIKSQLLKNVQDSYSKNYNAITVPVPAN